MPVVSYRTVVRYQHVPVTTYRTVRTVEPLPVVHYAPVYPVVYPAYVINDWCD